MPHPFDLTLDCTDADRLAPFWKLALGYVDEPPPAPFATREEWVAQYGAPEGPWDRGAWLCDPTGAGPRLTLLGVPEPKVVKNRLHLDIRVAGEGTPEERWGRITAHAEVLIAAGGTVLATIEGHHLVLADPEGNELCVA
jgi:hypothetical protein